jgi:hypothetical protein
VSHPHMRGDPDYWHHDGDRCAPRHPAHDELVAAAQAFLDAAALQSMTKAPDYIRAKRRLRAVLASLPEIPA